MTDAPAEFALDGDPLDTIGGDARVGYARVSTHEQNLRRQVDALTDAGCLRVFEEKLISGKNAERPELTACLDYLREGDTLIVLELSRLGRSLHDLLSLVSELRRRNVGFTSLHENLDTTPAVASCSTSSPRWLNSSENSSSTAPAKASPPRKPTASDSADHRP